MDAQRYTRQPRQSDAAAQPDHHRIIRGSWCGVSGHVIHSQSPNPPAAACQSLRKVVSSSGPVCHVASEYNGTVSERREDEEYSDNAAWVSAWIQRRQRSSIDCSDDSRAPWYGLDGKPVDAYVIGVAGGSASGKVRSTTTCKLPETEPNGARLLLRAPSSRR